MAFSESFQFGNSTFMNLENEVNREIERHIKPQSVPVSAAPKILDVIDESPTNSKSVLGKTRSRIIATTQHQQSTLARRRKFQKSKSDSMLNASENRLVMGDEKAESNDIGNCPSKSSYSDFFKSDFSFDQLDPFPENVKSNLIASMILVSDVEAALNLQQEKDLEKENQPVNNQLLDAATFSEGIECFLDDKVTSENHTTPIDSEKFTTNHKLNDEIWAESLQISEVLLRENIVEPLESPNLEEVISIDDSSFIYAKKTKKQEYLIQKELELSKKHLREILNESICLISPQKHPNDKPLNLLSKSIEDPSMSSMAFGQLKWSPPTQSQRHEMTSALKKPNENQKDSLDKRNYELKRDELKRISAWNLPEAVLKEYEKKGISKMFDWQTECLSNSKVLFEHCNLVYSAPTSAGKTLVGEILLIKTILERGKKAVIILPFISVVREKLAYLQDLLTSSGYRVEGFFGGYTPPGGFDSINVAICTIEKANSIVNKLLEQGKLDELGIVVVDEIHLISDRGRGYILELLLAKILYMSRKFAMQIQIITMSATLANVELLKRWLDAELYITNYRPVALQEMIKIGTKIYDSEMKFLREIETKDFPHLQHDPDHVAQLCIETLSDGCSVIVFCPSKDWCEKLAIQLAGAIHSVGKSGTEIGNRLRANLKRDEINEAKKKLCDIPTGLDSVLEKTITFACAFHHAGLTNEERDVIESSFKSGALKILVATSTLSSGVNLPARRVIIRSPLFGGKQMSSLTYKQMIGRAGRTGKDTLGESILICASSNANTGKELISAELIPISSCLDLDGSTHLKRAVLEVISSGVASSKSDIENFVNCTLMSTQKKLMGSEKDCVTDDKKFSIKRKNSNPTRMDNDKDCEIDKSLDFLIEYEFVRSQQNEETNEEIYVATRLGKACLASSMPPSDGLILFSELQKSRRCFVLESELHAVYLVTPFSVCYQMQDLDWLMYLDLWEKLSPAMKKVGELVGVKESFLVRAARGQSKLDYKLMQIHKRFYTALALQELVNETPIISVAAKYKCTRGLLQSLQQMASTFAGIVFAFCNSLNWSLLSLIVSQFKERLFFGVHHDLIDLLRLPDLNQKRARALFDAGIINLVELANADYLMVEKVLHNGLCFDSLKQHENENEYEAIQRNNVRNFFITGKTGLTVKEAAKMLILDARYFVQQDIGVGNINWSQKKGGEEMHMSCEEQKLLKRKSSEVSSHISPLKLTKSFDPTTANCNDRHIKNNNGLKEEQTTKSEEISDRIGNLKNILPQQKDSTNTEAKPNSKESERILTIVDKDHHNNRNLYEPKQLNNNLEETAPKYFSEQHVDKTKDINTRICSPESYNKVKCVKKQDNVSEKQQSCNENKKINILSEDKNALKCTYERTKDKTTKNDVNGPLYSAKDTIKSVSSILEPESNLNLNENDLQKRIASINPQTIFANDGKTETTTIANNKTDKALIHTKNQACSSKVTRCKKIPNDNPIAPKKKVELNQHQSSAHKTQQHHTKHHHHQPIRRSPRSHITSLTRTEISNTVSSKPKLTNCQENHDRLLDDSSFELNSGITKALDGVNEFRQQQSPMNKSSDEIASSQQQCNNSPGISSSRLLRSSRSQRQLSSSQKSAARKDLMEKALPLKPSNSIEMSDISIENSLIQNPMQLNSSHILSTSKTEPDAVSFKCIEIVDICGDQMLFKKALKELADAKQFGFSVGVQKQPNKRRLVIGANLLLNQIDCTESKDSPSEHFEFQIDETSYVSGVCFVVNDNVAYYLNLQSDGTCKGLTSETKLKYLRSLLENPGNTLKIFDSKEQLKTLRKAMPSLGQIRTKLEDPKVANWLLQPDKALNLAHLAQQFAPECKALVNLCGSGRGYNSIGLEVNSGISAKIRCSVEACVSVHILKGQTENLERIGNGQLFKFFIDLEMPLQLSLCDMETYGFPSNEDTLRKLFQQMVESMKKLEAKIYEMHGSRFNLGSSSAVARVLGLHRKANGRISTSKQILEKIDSPMAQLIINYRKLSVTLTKNIQPLLKSVKNNRIFGHSLTFTSTGRISMTEPNLQNVAKDFEVELSANEIVIISCRSSFFPSEKGRCLISSDFCQLEMRILAHMSQDPKILHVMNSEADVFTAIAARWNKIPEERVSEQLRNGTKQICYGIVYGMGIRSLAESLKCTEQEALTVSEQFHAAYPGIRSYSEKVVKFARHNGYIETITGRRRYLDHINSGEPSLKNQAERQAVNSTIQGSAADISKSAILRMEKNISKYREKLGIQENSVNLVLHLHDELIFEVPEDKAKKIAKVLSVTMENCVKLSVPLRVKLKMGKSWGDLKEFRY